MAENNEHTPYNPESDGEDIREEPKPKEDVKGKIDEKKLRFTLITKEESVV